MEQETIKTLVKMYGMGNWEAIINLGRLPGVIQSPLVLDWRSLQRGSWDHQYVTFDVYASIGNHGFYEYGSGNDWRIYEIICSGKATKRGHTSFPSR